MIEERAIVISSDASVSGNIAVRVDRKSACESCQMKAGCGQKLVNDTSQRKCIEFELENNLGAKVGDRVTLAIPESSFIQASFVMYIIPLIFMMIGAVLGERYFVLSDIYVFLCSIVGFISGVLVARKFAKSKQSNPDYQPHIVAVEPSQHQSTHLPS